MFKSVLGEFGVELPRDPLIRYGNRDRVGGRTMPERPERNVEAPEKPYKPSSNVALTPIHATPEEIAQTLFQRPPR